MFELRPYDHNRSHALRTYDPFREMEEMERAFFGRPFGGHNFSGLTEFKTDIQDKGDSFLLTFGSRFLAQSGSRNATAYLAVTYENDSVAAVSLPVNVSSGSTLRLSPCSLKAKRLDGYIMMARRERTDNESDVSILLLDRIQLMRFHHKESVVKAAETSAPVAVPERRDTVDSLKPRVHRLGDRPLPKVTKPALPANKAFDRSK